MSAINSMHVYLLHGIMRVCPQNPSFSVERIENVLVILDLGSDPIHYLPSYGYTLATRLYPCYVHIIMTLLITGELL